jgi:hypothetical protein
MPASPRSTSTPLSPSRTAASTPSGAAGDSPVQQLANRLVLPPTTPHRALQMVRENLDFLERFLGPESVHDPGSTRPS